MGTQTREGIVASKKEWIGKTMVLYKDEGDHKIHPGNFIGYYEVQDTSKAGNPVAEGTVIDIWIDSYEEAINNGCINVIFQIVESEG